ncbi:hypothetical protein GQ53DRAFT_597353, partial [Thozetella sp. PMI_491]
IFALAAIAEAGTLQKRCSPAYDSEYLHGYLPPVPCWQENDPACRPYIAKGTQMTLDPSHNLAIIYGISASCASDITEEISRTRDGRKNFGWLQKIGNLTLLGDGTLIISGMSNGTMEAYKKL